MPLPKELTTVTTLSKSVALLMFILLPIVAFLLGAKYQRSIQNGESPVVPTGISCTADAKMCPDGSAVGRTGPNCEFALCPTATPAPSHGGCVRDGCSNELCVDKKSEHVSTSCIYQNVYKCFQYSTCERKTGGQCGWTKTSQYLQCVSNNGSNNQPVI